MPKFGHNSHAYRKDSSQLSGLLFGKAQGNAIETDPSLQRNKLFTQPPKFLPSQTSGGVSTLLTWQFIEELTHTPHSAQGLSVRRSSTVL
jgi:hypothetical protein